MTRSARRPSIARGTCSRSSTACRDVDAALLQIPLVGFLALRNDLGLLEEQYDPVEQRQVGNFTQALSHVSLINTARNLSAKVGPAAHRGR